MATKKYRVIIEQIIEAEVDTNKGRKEDIKLIKKEITNDPPYIDICGTDISYKTTNDNDEHFRIKFKKFKKIADYKICPKCKGTGLIPKRGLDLYYNENDTEDCYRCGGRGEVIKKRRKK